MVPWPETYRKTPDPVKVECGNPSQPCNVIVNFDGTYKPGAINLIPGKAFGSGKHPATQLCMKALRDNVRKGCQVIDVGTGTGILAIWAVMLGAKTVLAADTETKVVYNAYANAKLNKMERIISVCDNKKRLHYWGMRHADIIVANISLGVIKTYLYYMDLVLGKHGILILSGIPAD